MTAGVDNDLEAYLWNELQPYYGSGLTPQPDDRWQTTLRIDPLDLIDIADRLWEQRGWGEPDYDRYPAIDADTTVLGLAQWLQLQKNSQGCPPAQES